MDSLTKEEESLLSFLYLFKAELTAVGSFPPVTNCNTQDGAGFGIAAQSNAQTLLHIAATVTGSLNAFLKRIISFMLTGVHIC